MRLRLCSLLILVIGLCAAALIYVATDETSVAADGSQILLIDGVAYPIAQDTSKLYVRDLQRYGGKAAVLFDEFNRWFASLWRGRALAGTVVWIAVLVSFALLLLANLFDTRR